MIHSTNIRFDCRRNGRDQVNTKKVDFSDDIVVESYGKKYSHQLEGTMGRIEKYIFSFALHWLLIPQLSLCHGQNIEKPLISEKYSMLEPSEFSTSLDLI